MRENKYDTLKGILIVLTVFAHLLISYDYLPKEEYSIIINFIYLFHMPLFFIISGKFSRKNNWKTNIQYLLLFLLMNLSFSLYDYIHLGAINIWNILYSSWYLLFLCIYRMILLIPSIKTIINKRITLYFSFLLASCSGFIIADLNFLRLFYFFFFFLYGYQFEEQKQKKKWYQLIIPIIIYIIVLSKIESLDFLMADTYNRLIEFPLRIILIIANCLLFRWLQKSIPNKKIPIITNLGTITLYIYVLHRIPTLIINYYYYPLKYYWLISIVITILLCILTLLLSKQIKYFFHIKWLVPIILVMIIFLLWIPQSNREMSVEEQYDMNNSISIGFVGDLILLENQLKLSNNNFDYMFENTKEYFQKTDYVFGVLEGPVDDNNDYSYGNYSDNKKVRLNYPTSFLKSIENSGIDFVTIANNHILDSGIESYKQTINNLDNSNIDYTGTKNNDKIIEIEGIKIGVLAYTYGLNYLDSKEYQDYTNFLVEPYSKDFNKTKEKIHQDFINIRDKVDILIVMPHYGTEFSYQIDTYQEIWNRFFIQEGADIIFGDHSHVIEPIQFKKGSIIINSPGNYINSYTGYNSAISMYVTVYIDRNTHKIKSSSITPLFATKDQEGKYYPELLENTNANNQVRAINILEDTIFHNKIKEIKNTYYYFPNQQYKYENKYNMELTNEDKESLIFQKISEHDKICFIGDSITEGTKNNYHPWYEPLMQYFDKDIINISKGSYTTQDVLDNFQEKIKTSECDLTILNIGTNDIRYHETNVDNYINNIHEIIALTKGEVIILAPWQTTINDYNIDKNNQTKRKLYDIYNQELEKIENIYYINPNPYIQKAIEYNGESSYIIDGVHPNQKAGIQLYSFATMRSIQEGG